MPVWKSIELCGVLRKRGGGRDYGRRGGSRRDEKEVPAAKDSVYLYHSPKIAAEACAALVRVQRERGHGHPRT